jgi:hypothetical protein
VFHFDQKLAFGLLLDPLLESVSPAQLERLVQPDLLEEVEPILELQEQELVAPLLALLEPLALLAFVFDLMHHPFDLSPPSIFLSTL